MKRRSIKVIKSRLEDIEVGDVVNRSPEAELGWFEVAAISTLFNGNIQLANESEQLTVSGDHKDMVGLQLVEEVVLDERGVLALAAPVVAAATPIVVPTPPSPLGYDVAPPASTPSMAQTEPLDPVAEAAAAAEVAVAIDLLPAVRQSPAVDLGLVLSLLDQLDVGEAPEISTEYEPGMPLPANAFAVDGGALPAKPSYKTPVVIPEGGMLPRRGRAA